MLVGDILQLVGEIRLDQLQWGANFVEVCNQRLAPHTTNRLPVVRITMTGAEVRDSLYHLPTKEMTEFLMRDFDLGSQTLMPLEDEEPTPGHRPILTLKKSPANLAKTKQRSWALLLGALLVILSLLVAIAMSSATAESGTLPNKKDVESITDIIVDVITIYLRGDKPTKTS